MRLQKKRIAALLMTGAMLFSALPVNALAVENPGTGGLCEHHTEHTADCGYTEGTPGTPCGHEHTDECYTLVTECVHEHTEDCYPVESVSANTATPSSTEERKPSACTHVCSEESGCVTKELDCQHEHDDACGYSPEEPGTPCTFVCEVCNPADGEPAGPEQEPECSCETLCTEGNVNVDCPVCGADGADLDQCTGEEKKEAPVCNCTEKCTEGNVNADCPVCGLEDADLSQCKGTAELASPSNATALSVEDVQKLIDALPTAEALAAMTQEEQGTVYTNLQTAYDAYEALTDEEKQEITGAEIFDALFAVFNGMTNALDDSGFTVEGGTPNTDYTLSDNTLTIKTSEPLTISGGTKDNPITGQIVIQSGTSANLTLAGVHIQGTEYTTAVAAKSAIELSSSSTLTLTLADSSNNTLKGGSGNNSSGTNGPAAPGIHVPDGTTLTVLCGAADSTGDHICNSSSNNCGKLAITGGASDSGAGGVGIGGGAPVSGNTPCNFTGQPCGTVLLLGGGISVTGGTGSGSVQAMDIGGSRGEGSGSGGAGGTVIILTNVTSTSGSLNIGGGSSTNPSVTPNNGAGIKPSSTGNNTYEVYGNLTLPDNLTIPEGVTVTIPSGATLTVPSGKTLTNYGTITGDGTLTLNGNANGNGSVSVTNFTPKTQTSTPSAPSGTSAVTANSVTLTAVTDSGGVGGIQYGYTTGTGATPGNWQTSTTFNNLSPGTAYTFYARYAGNGFYAPSAASSTGLTVTTSALVDAETPNITTHPQGGTYTVGADAALSVAASVSDGGTLSYQWYSNTTDSTTGGSEISGATSSSYTPPTSAAGTTWYYCVVINTNNSVTGKKTATATSNTAEIKVSPAAPTEYTITFDGNGGTSPAAQTTTDQKLTSLPTSTQSGYSFNGWYTAKTGGDQITPDTVFSASMTVYAQWTKDTPPQPAEYTITFDGNGGTSPAAQTTTGQKLTSLPASTQSGYSFNGWYTAKTGGDKITPDTVFSASVTVYAQWTKNSEGDGGGSSSGDSSGGSGSSSSSGGSSGSDSGSSGSSAAVSRPDPNATDTPATGQTAPVEPGTDGSASISGSTIQDAINKAAADAKKNGNTGNGIAVTVPIQNAADAGSLAITIPAGTLDELVSAKVRRFDITTNGLPSFGFTLDTLKMLDTQSQGGDLILRMVKTAVASNEAKEAIGTRPAYDISLVYVKGGVETPLTDWQGRTISVKLPYTPAANEQSGNLYAVCVDGNGKAEWLAKSSYDPDQKAVLFEAEHFSIYGVGYRAPAEVFTDISGHWAGQHILFAAGRGLIDGAGDGRFAPDAGMTRGMFVTALGRLAGIDPADYRTGKFTDVPEDAWYAPYVNWAAQTGIVSGAAATGPMTFSPDSGIAREEMAVILKNYAAKMGYALPRTLKAVTFTDRAQISSWATDAVRAMQQAGILAGKDGGRFDPKGTATRAEVAIVLHRFVEVVIDPQTANGWVQNDSGDWYYYRDGEPVKGWLSDEQKWYWLDQSSGKMFAGGWKQIGGGQYYFHADGVMDVNAAIEGYAIGPDGRKTA